MAASCPIAEITRGDHLESRHMGHFVVCDSTGRVVLSGGNAEAPTYPRSAIKALQALNLVASGAADRFALDDAELALACASHTGLPEHTATAASALRKAGRDVACLECGAHWPSSASAARALAASGQVPSALHNNCSGKHAGFVCLAVAEGRDPAGYVRPDHPTMAGITRTLSAVMGVALGDAERGTDGCSIPTYRVPLRAIATGFARFGASVGLPQGLEGAAARLRRAAAAWPGMLAGPGRIDTEVTQALGDALFLKTGAEGVHAGAFPALGLGFAVKAEDGANRASDAAAAALAREFLGPHPVLDAWSDRALVNWNGIAVGAVRAVMPATGARGDGSGPPRT